MKKYILTITIFFLILSLISCTKSENVKSISPFNNIPISSTKRIEFSNFTVTSKEKELGRSKMVTGEYDIQNIIKTLQTITCIESNNKEIKPDFQISLIDNIEKEKNYIYSIGVSKNQIYLYKYSNPDTIKFVYEDIDSKIIEELRSLYDDMNYKEVIVGTGAMICGILIEVIAKLEKTLYWAITDGFYHRNFIYNLSILLIIIGLILIFIGFRKKEG